jgi:hypothetical protein
MGKKTVIIVLVILLGMYLSFQYNNSNSSVFDIEREFGITGNVVSSGIYQGSGGLLTGDIIEEFNDLYVEKSRVGEKVYLIYGDYEEVYMSNYEEINKGSVGIVTGKSFQGLAVSEDTYTSRKLNKDGDNVKVVIGGEEIEFSLGEGESLYFIISEDKKGKTSVLR